MSSQKRKKEEGRKPVKIHDEIYEQVRAIQFVTGAPSVSQVIADVLVYRYPNIEEITRKVEADKAKSKQQAAALLAEMESEN